MNALKKTLVAATLVLASTASFAAPSTYNLGALSGTSTTNLTVAGSFSDTFNFTIMPSDIGSVSVTSTVLKLGSLNIFNIDNLNLSIASATGAYNMLSAGSYTAVVTGDATGVSGGNYTFATIASPVPEASTLSMMLAGFGLVGLMSYRRRSAV